MERVLVGIGGDPADVPAEPTGSPAELLDAWARGHESLEARWDKLLADAPKLARRLNRWRDDRDQQDKLLRAWGEAVEALPPRKRKAEDDRFVTRLVGLLGDGDGS